MNFKELCRLPDGAGGTREGQPRRLQGNGRRAMRGRTEGLCGRPAWKEGSRLYPGSVEQDGAPSTCARVPGDQVKGI